MSNDPLVQALKALIVQAEKSLMHMADGNRVKDDLLSAIKEAKAVLKTKNKTPRANGGET